MMCAHVLGLIDAGPFAEYPPEHLDAAREHARECPTCGPALAVATSLQAELATLPEPEAPADLANIVMARIAQLPESDAAAATGKQPAASPVRRRDWTPMVTAIGGLVAGLAMILTMPSGVEGLGGFVTPRLSGGALATMPATVPAALTIGAGLVVYVVGLFAPVRVKS
jgi:hypothetical protein